MRYNLWDCHETARLFGALKAEMQDRRLEGHWDYYTTWVQPLCQAVLNMQRRGMLLDRDAKHKYQVGLNRELRETDRDIVRFARDSSFAHTDKFPNSKAQVSKLLFEHLGLRGGHKTKTGTGKSVEQSSLVSVLRQLRKRDADARPLLENLFHRSRLQTIKDRYLNLPVDPDGRVRARVKMTGTKTFRFAYADPALQQYPPEIRYLFTAAPGHVYLAPDYRQVEARVMAILSDDHPSLDAFARGDDIHRVNALDLFALSAAEWDQLGLGAKPYRNTSKGFLYRITYGGEGATDKTKVYCPCPNCKDKSPPTVDMSPKEILAAEARWFAAHPAVRRFQVDLIEEVRRQGYYESPFGPRCWMAEEWSTAKEREIKNKPMQMNTALLMNERQVKLDRLDCPLLLQMHDGFIAEVPESPGSAVDQWAADIKGVLEEPCPPLGGTVFPVDMAVGYNWGSFAPNNTNGLKEIG
jgi:DNA polymerase-1